MAAIKERCVRVRHQVLVAPPTARISTDHIMVVRFVHYLPSLSARAHLHLSSASTLLSALHVVHGCEHRRVVRLNSPGRCAGPATLGDMDQVVSGSGAATTHATQGIPVPTVTSSASPGRISRPQKARSCSGITRPEGMGNRCTTRSVSPAIRPLGSRTPRSSRAANTPGSHSRRREGDSPSSEDRAAPLPPWASRPGSAHDPFGMPGMMWPDQESLCTSGAHRSNHRRRSASSTGSQDGAPRSVCAQALPQWLSCR